MSSFRLLFSKPLLYRAVVYTCTILVLSGCMGVLRFKPGSPNESPFAVKLAFAVAVMAVVNRIVAGESAREAMAASRDESATEAHPGAWSR